MSAFRLSSNSGRTTDSDSVNPGSSPGGRAEKRYALACGFDVVSLVGAVPEWLRERTATPRTSVRVRPASLKRRNRPRVGRNRWREWRFGLLLSLSSNFGRTADFGSANPGSSPGRDAKSG